MKGKLLFVPVVLFVFGIFSCFLDSGLERFQKMAIGSWSSADDRDFDNMEITKNKIIIPGEKLTINYRFDKDKIYLNVDDDEKIEVNYTILSKDAFTVEFDDEKFEIKFTDRNNASILDSDGDGLRFKRK